MLGCVPALIESANWSPPFISIRGHSSETKARQRGPVLEKESSLGELELHRYDTKSNTRYLVSV